MAENPRIAEIRDIVDTWFHNYGIDYRELNKPGPAGKNLQFLKSKGLDDAQANALLGAFQVIMDPTASTGMDGSTRLDTFDRSGAFNALRNPGRPYGAEQPAQAPQQDPAETERQNLTKWMTEFTQSLGRPLDMSDPVFASLSNLGAARASMGVGANGIRVGRGGLGELAVQQGAMNASLPYAQQRQQMLQQGLDMLSRRDIGLEQLRQGKYGLNLQQAEMQNRVNQQMYGQAADAAGGPGGVIGGLLGGLAGGIATIATKGAAAPAIPGLIAGGSQIGAGLGMQGVQRPTYSAPRPYGSFGRNGGGYT